MGAFHRLAGRQACQAAYWWVGITSVLICRPGPAALDRVSGLGLKG